MINPGSASTGVTSFCDDRRAGPVTHLAGVVRSKYTCLIVTLGQARPHST